MVSVINVVNPHDHQIVMDLGGTNVIIPPRASNQLEVRNDQIDKIKEHGLLVKTTKVKGA